MMTATMALRVRSFDVPDESGPIGGLARVETINLAGTTANRVTFRPGFRWTEHAKPIAGTDLCQGRHTGYVVSGRSGVRLADGTERELAAGDVFDIPPGHDLWVIGDEPYVAVDFSPAAPAESRSGTEATVPPKDHRAACSTPSRPRGLLHPPRADGGARRRELDPAARSRRRRGLLSIRVASSSRTGSKGLVRTVGDSHGTGHQR